jgi:hypothetical protein
MGLGGSVGGWGGGWEGRISVEVENLFNKILTIDLDERETARL